MRLPEGDVDEIHAGSEADKVRHLAGGYAGRDLNNDDVVLAADEQLRKSDPVLQPERANRSECDRFGGRESGARELGGK